MIFFVEFFRIHCPILMCLLENLDKDSEQDIRECEWSAQFFIILRAQQALA